ncbi:hypothetical protein BaRGS_00030117 [Batillaria attramentaria]|uniref:N-acetyltransferase domain-containing protein n=1 Tax=Batillaria attramentaria TaxID=370345 RepID=A0ABD0JUB3_9CAEN|nr:hypothetical protein BaRGS_008402 [Batillaria attramentaria]
MVKIESESNATDNDTHVTSASAAHDVMLLPLHTTLPDGRHVTISDIPDHQLSEVYAMIQQAAYDSDGFGWDEFPTEAHFRCEVNDGKNLQICLQETCKMIAVLLLTPSRFYRGQRVADPWLIVHPDERRKRVGEFCFGLGLDYCRRLGYQAAYADTFTNNVAMRRILEKLGFQRVGLLPMGATLRNGTIVGSVIYYKDLRQDQAETVPADEDVQRIEIGLNQHHVDNDVNHHQLLGNGLNPHHHIDNGINQHEHLDNGTNSR